MTPVMVLLVTSKMLATKTFVAAERHASGRAGTKQADGRILVKYKGTRHEFKLHSSITLHSLLMLPAFGVVLLLRGLSSGSPGHLRTPKTK